MKQTRNQQLLNALSQRILVIDGAMGTAIQDQKLSASDFGGSELEGCNEYLVISKPDAISQVHESHLKAGCDIILTNTFGSTPLVLDEYGLGAQAEAITKTACTIAVNLAKKYSTPEKPRFVAGSIGPTTKAISVTGGISFSDLIQTFYIQCKALFEGGVDYFLIETCQDTRNIKAALIATERVFAEKQERIPVAVSATIEPTGTMLAGQTVEALMASLSHTELLYLGLNCATGPEFMTDHIRTLAANAPFRIACVPNAGLPDEHGRYLETPQMLSSVLKNFLANGWLNLVGGCCGTTACHTKSLVELVKEYPPRIPVQRSTSILSGIDYLEITPDMRPLIVGERTNVIGSKKFKELIVAEKFEEAAEIARTQVKKGAHIIDVCLANPDRDEKSDVESFFKFLIKMIKAPIMIDSTDSEVIELALTYCQGKAIINSINLEDGEERFEKVIPLAKKYGAALVVGTIDEDPAQGMGVTRERKLQIAERSYQLLTEKYGVAPQDIYWDPLVFPCGTGDAQYVGSALETVEGIRLIKNKFPLTKTILGISNVSFGLPNAGREVLNSVFLYHCVQAGLDLAIVNSEKLERYAQIPDEERKMSEALLFTKAPEALPLFAAHFRTRKSKVTAPKASLPLKQRLSAYIVEGTKDGLCLDLEEALKTSKPLEIINGPLMNGMDEVGKLFNANKLIVAEVLQSAEAMKTAVNFLEPFMEKSESSLRGKVILATVKGDVHDIGKNLVEIILSNNGFQVINLGIKVPPEQLIHAIEQHRPDIVGLSGLLVKSAQQMVVTADDFSKAGIHTPILVGGAALSSNFVDKQIAKAYTTGTVAYASDAMQGLDLAKTIVNPESFKQFKLDLDSRRSAQASAGAEAKQVERKPVSSNRSPSIQLLSEIPNAPDFVKHVSKNQTPIEQIWSYINPMMLYNRHLGIKGDAIRQIKELGNPEKIRRALAISDSKALGIYEAVEQIKERYKNTTILKPQAVWQFFKAYSEGNSLHLGLNSTNGIPFKSKLIFDFPRQLTGPQLCISDYCDPNSQKGDNVALFVVSVGTGVREESEKLKLAGDYLNSHILQALALESAEGYAELLHAQIRRMWGYPDPTDMTMLERFQAKYHGKRYSFGYPACPDLNDQKKLFAALKPEEIGVHLTEGDMMDPEASVSAIVFHHPQASYFSVQTGTVASAEMNELRGGVNP